MTQPTDPLAFWTVLLCLFVLAALALNGPECPDGGCRRAHQAHQPRDEERP